MRFRVIALSGLLFASCPALVSLDCATCDGDEDCAPQGLQCRAGVCRGGRVCPLSGDVDGGADAGDGGAPEAGDGGAPDAGDGGAPDAGDGGAPDAGDGGAPDAGDGGAPDAGDAGRGDGGSADAASLPPLGAVPDASTMFEDDFETGPAALGSRWRVDNSNTSQVFDVVGSAALGGSFGLSLRDTSTGNGPNGFLAARDFAPKLTGDVYLRTHVWLSANGTTDLQLMTAYSAGVADGVVGEFGVFTTTQLTAPDRASVQYCKNASTFPLNTWHVVDLALLKVGTSAGIATLRLDGALVCEFSGASARDWSSAAIDTVALGTPSMAAQWVGELRFDNFALTLRGPPPARVVLTAATALPAGRCLASRLELRDAYDGGVARAVRPVRVSLSADAGTFFSDLACETPTTSAVIPAGQPALVLGFSASAPGPVAVSVSDTGVDLAGDSKTWTITP